MRRTILTAATALVALAPSAIGQFNGPAPVAWRWAETTSAAPAGTPQVDGDTVFVASGGRVYALERATGNQKWRFPVAEPLEGSFRSGASLSRGLIVAANENRTVYAVEAETGRLRWQRPTTDAVVGAPVHVGNRIVYATTANELHALDAANGQPLWEKPVVVPAGVYPNMAAWQDNVVFLTRKPSLVALNVTTQRQSWEVGLRSVSATAAPVVFADTVFINTGNVVAAVRAATGGRRAEQSLEGTLAFAAGVSEQGVAVISAEGRLYVFDLNLRPIFRAGVPLGSQPVASPAFVGRLVAVPTANGAIQLVDPKTGEVEFVYVVPPMARAARNPSADGGGGAGRGVGTAGAGGAPTEASAPRFVLAAGPAALGGTTMLVLGRDGSLLAFDRVNGVDLTPPSVRLLWPNPGDEISGRPPLEVAFLIEDLASGVNPDSVKVFVDGQEVAGVFSRDGFLTVRFSAAGPNTGLADGRRVFAVVAADWLGNEVRREFGVLVDNQLPPLGGPPSSRVGTSPGGGDSESAGRGGRGGRAGGRGG